MVTIRPREFQQRVQNPQGWGTIGLRGTVGVTKGGKRVTNNHGSVQQFSDTRGVGRTITKGVERGGEGG